jgi:hypothetical protein
VQCVLAGCTEVACYGCLYRLLWLGHQSHWRANAFRHTARDGTGQEPLRGIIPLLLHFCLCLFIHSFILSFSLFYIFLNNYFYLFIDLCVRPAFLFVSFSFILSFFLFLCFIFFFIIIIIYLLYSRAARFDLLFGLDYFERYLRDLRAEV